MKSFLVALAGALLALAPPASARPVTDSAGRTVELPAQVAHVFPAGPPAAVIVYMVAPDALMGWTRALGPQERAFLPARYADLPELGRLTGRGNTVNLEAVVTLKPDLVLDIGSVGPTYVSLADRVHEQTGVPAVLLDGKLADTPRLLRQVGDMLGARDTAEKLARYAEETLEQARRRTAQVAPDKRLKVYMARGPRGLETGIRGSINVEALELAGADNVAAESLGAGGLVSVSLEQVLAWQPDAIVTIDRNFYAAVRDDPAWQGVKAVREHRVYLAPALPFGWTDAPPAANRLIGVRWLGKVLYPALYPNDLRAEARRFYALFYHQEPSEPQLDELLAGAH
jgi:iron complex transport system substrate-binding protein